ncbi:MAG: hypothetical protein KDB23_27915, partial [Planctomycetales bacterium]|nr:hypothetical protein [Planctomycetales bacterium]
FLVVLAVAFNEMRRQNSGTRKEMFPGVLGFCTVPILALLMGIIVFVFSKQISFGLATGIVALLGLLAWKLWEVFRIKRTV